jgi:putative flippase GtrA
MACARLLVARTDRTLLQLARYAGAGFVASVVDYSLLFLLASVAGVHYLVAVPIAFVSGLLTHYHLSVSWVFSRRNLASKRLELFIYVSLGILGLLVNEGIIWFCTEVLHFHYMVSKLFYFVVYIFNFFIRKYCLFR